jgi:L-ribulose-5-phosphate 4-epimerase
VDTFSGYDYKYTPMVLVASHGPFTWGESPEKAVYHSVILEELARMAAITYSVNPEVNPVRRALIQKHFNRKHGENAYYGQKKEE